MKEKINPERISDNPALISFVNSSIFSASYTPSAFGIKELSPASAFLAVPLSKRFSSSIKANYLGNKIYSEFSMNIAAAFKFEEGIHIGASLNHNRLFIENYNNENIWFGNIGGIFEINEKLMTGFSLSNVNRSYYGKNDNTPLQKAVFGASYAPLENLYLSADIIIFLERSSGAAFSFRYVPESFLSLKFAFLTNPAGFEAGLRLNIFDNGGIFTEITYHEFLDLTANFGIVLKWD